MDWLSTPQAWIGLFTLTALEIVLGIDNIVFISIVAGKLPPGQQGRARRWGLTLALIPRIVLLLFIGVILRMSEPLITVVGDPHHQNPWSLSGKDLILIVGGLFLITKAVREIHDKLEGMDEAINTRAANSFVAVILQIAVINMVFSMDSLVTAIGMTNDVKVMIAAVVASTFVMMGVAGPVGSFVERHPTVKMLALSFLVLIGVNLLAEGFGQHIPKGYTYFAMAFSVGVEMVNLRLRTPKGVKPVVLHHANVPPGD